MEPTGSGILPSLTSPVRFRLSICTMRASTSGNSHVGFTQTTRSTKMPGSRSTSDASSTKGKIEKLVSALRAIDTTNSEVAEVLRIEADYFERNAERMRYPKFRRLHLFVGSGAIEVGCKTVIGSRLKQSGMFWTVRGANAIIALRCCHLNGRFEGY